MIMPDWSGDLFGEMVISTKGEEEREKEMALKPNEQAGLDQLVQKLKDLQSVVNRQLPINTPVDWSAWSAFLADIKQATGNLSNEASFVAVMLAKQYLKAKHSDLNDYNAAAKPQNAPGLDIDELTLNGRHIIAEVKTMEPNGQSDFGANQSVQVIKDLVKLESTPADFKYFFVTNRRAEQVVRTKEKYTQHLKSIEVVLLGDVVSAVNMISGETHA